MTKRAPTIIIHTERSNITSFLPTMINVITDRKFQQFSVFMQLIVGLVTSGFVISQGFLLLWVSIARKLHCPSCNSRSYGKRSTYGRSQDLLKLSIIIKWKVQRYSCKDCSKSFSSFTNTILSHHKSHPLVILIDKIPSLINFSIPRPYLFSSFNTLELRHENHNQQKHLSDAFDSTLLYFLQECLDEKLRRLCAGLFAIYFDNISKVHEITTMARKTIRRGKEELLQKLEINADKQTIRRSGGGRKSKIEKYKHLVLEFVEEYTAGDPMSRKKWMRISLRRVSDELDNVVSHVSVGKILKDKDYSLLVNKKTKRTRKRHPKRGVQFDFINSALKRFQTEGIPVFAIDGKKTEYIGPFKQYGKIWTTKDQQLEVYDHDYSNLAEGKLIPYGIYDYQQNEGYIVGGTSLETTEFAIDCLVIWWENRGSKIYPEVSEIALTCDAGKPNSYRGNLFKYLLQTKFVDKFGISVHVMHYAPGDSKYHIIERQLFSHVSLQFRGNPLFTYDKAMALIRGTRTNTGLEVRAVLQKKKYQRGIGKTITDADYRTTNISPAEINPEFNYTIQPRTKLGTLFTLIEAEKEQIDKQIWHFGNKGRESWEKGIEMAKQLSNDNCWRYHEVNDVILKDLVPKRVDSEQGRPGPNTEMYFEYYFHIEFIRIKSVEDYIEHLNNK